MFLRYSTTEINVIINNLYDLFEYSWVLMYNTEIILTGLKYDKLISIDSLDIFDDLIFLF